MNEDMRFIIRLLFAVLFISLLSAGVGMKLQKKATDRWYAEHQEPYCGPFGITSAMKVGDIYFCAASSQWEPKDVFYWPNCDQDTHGKVFTCIGAPKDPLAKETPFDPRNIPMIPSGWKGICLNIDYEQKAISPNYADSECWEIPKPPSIIIKGEDGEITPNSIPVNGKVSLLHKMAPGEEVPPKPVREVTYNCPEGWEASGAWNRETGVPLKSKPGLYTVHPLSCVRVSEDDPKEMINRLEKEGGHIDLTNSNFWSTDPTVPSSVTIGPDPGWVTTGKCDPKTGLPSCLIDHDAK